MKLVIDGVPLAQARLRHFTRAGMTRVYDPDTKEKEAIKNLISSAYKKDLFNHPRVSFVFHMPIPKSIPKKLLPLYESGLLKHEKKPDIDNLVKPYLDCMDGIVYECDQKVQLGHCVKVYHPYPKTIIIINETSEILSPLEVDPMTWFALFGKESGKLTYAETVSLSDFYTPDLLKFEKSFYKTYPVQDIPASEQVPLVQWGLARLNLGAIPTPVSRGS